MPTDPEEHAVLASLPTFSGAGLPDNVHSADDLIFHHNHNHNQPTPLDMGSLREMNEDNNHLETSTPLSPCPQDITQEIPTMSRGKLIVLSGVFMGTSMTAAMSGNCATIGIATISKDLGITTSEQQWLQTSFSIAFGCFLLVGGRVADIFGRKWTYIVGMIFFALWTIFSGVMKNKIGIFVARALCGIASSLAIPSAIGMIAQTFPPGRMRSIEFAIFGSGFPIGSAFGLVLSGSLIEINWRLPFFIVGGISLLPPLGAFFNFLDMTEGEKHEKPRIRDIDFVGAGLVTVGLVLLLFSLSDGLSASQGFKTPYVVACLIISIVSLTAFVFWEHYVEKKISKPPLMKLSLFTRGHGKLAAVYASATFTLMAFSAFSFMATIFYQDYLGLTPIETTLRVIPMAVSGAACNLLVGILAARVKGQVLFALGCMGTMLACLLFAVQDAEASYWEYQFLAMCFIVFGADFTQSTSTIFVSRLVDTNEQSVAGGLFQTFTQSAGAIGTTLMTVIYTSVAEKYETNDEGQLSTLHSAAFLKGLKISFWFGFALSGISLVIVILTMRGMGYVEERKSKVENVEAGVAEDGIVEEDGNEEKAFST